MSGTGGSRGGRIRPTRRVVLAVIVGLLALMAGARPVGAHTGFESSTPADGSTVDQPVDVVTIVFTGDANPVGDRFVARTPEGVLQKPVSIDTVDNRTFTVNFEPPLAGGQVGIRWNVQAADAHPIEGAFSFTVNAPVPTTTVATTTPPTTTATTTATTETQPGEDAVAEPPSSAEATADAPTRTDPAVVAPSDDATPDESAGASVDDSVAGVETQSLDEFLAVDEPTPGQTTATVGRVVGFLGVTLGLGTFAFVATAMRGRRHEIRRLLAGVRILGAVIAVGAAIEYVGVARIAAESLGSAWSTAPGFATVLRLVGGVALAVGIGGAIVRERSERSDGRPLVARSLSSAVVDVAAERPPTPRRPDVPIFRWTPTAASWPALCGLVLVIASFWFDGHTVSKGFRPLHALVNSVHVAAAAVWVGGVATMAVVAWTRHRDELSPRLVELVVRFSKIATIALVAVVAAGGIMAVFVLDSFGELTSTSWGKILLLKTVAVGLAALGGAYNHFRLLPALETDPDSPELLAELRSALTVEAILLTFVVTVTAWLVVAAS